MTEQKWNVGDPVVIEKAKYNCQTEPDLVHGTVVKIARKYFTAEIVTTFSRFGGDDAYTRTTTDQFEIVGGRQRPVNPQYTSYLDHAYTPQEWESQVFRRAQAKRLREDHRVYGFNSDSTLQPDRWSDGHLVELLDLLDRVKAHNETKDLD